jgi:FkbM family methyltransferase
MAIATGHGQSPTPSIDILDRMGQLPATARMGEEEVAIRDVYRALNLAGCAVDGGANTGMHTNWLAAIPELSRIYAVEPAPVTFATLEKETAWSKTVERVRAALQDDPDLASVTFHFASTQPGRSGINPIMRSHGQDYDAPITVPATTIDKLTEGAPDHVRFIKLDLEGGEFAALKGARRVLREDRPVVVFENGCEAPGMNGYSVAEFLAFWDELDYLPLTFDGRPLTPETIREFWYAWAIPREADYVADMIGEITASALPQR